MDDLERAAAAAEKLNAALEQLRVAYGPSLQAAANQLHQLQETVSARAQLEAVHSANALASRQLAEIQPILTQLLESRRESAKAIDDVIRTLTAQITESYLNEVGRSLDGWTKRWQHQALEAEGAFRNLAQRAREDPAYRRFASEERYAKNLSDRDLSIAQLYYYGHMSQAQIGDLIGLSQPAIAGRLRRVEASVAEELLAEKLTAIAQGEGWKVRREAYIDLDAFHFAFDLLAISPDNTELGIEIKVSEMPSITRLAEWGAYLAQFDPPTYVAVAIFDLSDLTAGLLVDADFKHFQLKGLAAAGYAEIKPLLNNNLSLNAALERVAA